MCYFFVNIHCCLKTTKGTMILQFLQTAAWPCVMISFSPIMNCTELNVYWELFKKNKVQMG